MAKRLFHRRRPAPPQPRERHDEGLQLVGTPNDSERADAIRGARLLHAMRERLEGQLPNPPVRGFHPPSALVTSTAPTMPKQIRRRDTEPEEGLDKYGEATFADPVNNKYPIDTPGRIKAAWAYIHQPDNASKYTAAEVRTIKARIHRAAKARKVALPDPDEFVALMDRVRKKRR